MMFNGYATYEDGHAQALVDFWANRYGRDFNNPPCGYAFIVGYTETMNHCLEQTQTQEEYVCCPRVAGTGHKMGCSYGGGRTVVGATMTDDGTLVANTVLSLSAADVRAQRVRAIVAELERLDLADDVFTALAGVAERPNAEVL